MEKEFVPYEEALALKELGFDERWLGWFIKDNTRLNLSGFSSYVGKVEIIKAPLYQQAFRWFREKHNLDGKVIHTMNCTKGESKYLTKYSYIILGNMIKSSSTVFRTVEGNIEMFYEEAELACLRKLIEMIKKKI